MDLEILIKNSISKAIFTNFNVKLDSNILALQPTKAEFEGDFTFVTFSLAKELKQAPLQIAKTIGEFIVADSPIIENFNTVQGFLNISIKKSVWFNQLAIIDQIGLNYGNSPDKGIKIMVEYASPNTNKPLHLGHLRNNFLGFSVAEILKANGFEVQKTNIINNRGIHICKSMLAYQLFGENETPETSGIKGDHLVGKYYVKFDVEYKAEIQKLIQNGMTEEEAKKQAPLIKKAQKMLLDWESGEEETLALWTKMNEWVYAGFDETFRKMGVDFDTIYYESNMYLDGKQTVEDGLKSGVFFRKPDNSVWVDLTEEGLDQKLVLRADGTSVYITQDIGLADKKYEDFPMQKSVYVVGNEQDYHFEVLFKIMKKLGRPYADGLYHLSYGMVDLPSGKMKSREGTVVDADELIEEMEATAKAKTQELGKIDGFDEAEAQKLYEILGLGALKYFLLKVDPKKRMLFNPAESIEFQGNTGPFIQYTYARIQAVLRKAQKSHFEIKLPENPIELLPIEIELVNLLYQYPVKVKEAGNNYAPSLIAQFVYDLAKTFNSFYAELSILGEENLELKQTRIVLAKAVGQTILHATGLLGIQVPERM
ncbi:MAG: arginine--tRNA ligase [Bacteroidota bacterium]